MVLIGRDRMCRKRTCTPALALTRGCHWFVQRPKLGVRALQWKQQHWQEVNLQMQKVGWDTDRVNLAQSGYTAAWGQHLRTHEE